MKNNIESVVCEIINCPNSAEIQNTFQKIKTNMESHEYYKQVLSEYEVAGLEIAKILKEDYSESKDKDIIVMLFNSSIIPINESIINNKNEEAIFKLSQMLYILEDYYNISASKIKEEKQLQMEPPKNVKMKKLGTYFGYRF